MKKLSTCEQFIIGFRRMTKYYLGNKWCINRIVFLCLATFTLASVVFVNIGWLVMRLGTSHIQISDVFPVRKGQLDWSETDLDGPQPELRNSQSTTTTQPKTNSTEEHQKLLFIYDYVINEPDKCKDSVPFLILLIMVERWQKEARHAIRQTWGKEDLLPGVKLLRLFFLGKDTKWTDDAQQSVLEESQAYHDIIQQDYLDTYNNLTTKVLMGINWVATHCPGASYVMKTDSDMFINTEYLINGLLKPDQPPRLNYFTGVVIRNGRPVRRKRSRYYLSPEEYPDDKFPVYCSGTGYVFSTGLASKIVKVFPAVSWIHFEDVYVGLCLQQIGVQPVVPPKRTDFNTWKLPYTNCGYNKIATSHGFSPGEIISTWNQLQQNKHGCV